MKFIKNFILILLFIFPISNSFGAMTFNHKAEVHNYDTTGSNGITAGIETTAVSQAWLEGCNNMEYMTVEAALTQLAGKIQQLGLTFQMSEQSFGQEGSISLNVHQFGEKHDPAGTHILTPTIPEDLSMTVEYSTGGKGGVRISAKLN
jgi:hypothetical protein